jgi:hypothetical protein
MTRWMLTVSGLFFEIACSEDSDCTSCASDPGLRKRMVEGEERTRLKRLAATSATEADAPALETHYLEFWNSAIGLAQNAKLR